MDRKQFWLRAALHAVALGALVYVLMGAAGPQWETSNRHDRVLEAGVWAVRFLLFSLAISPANAYLGWRSAIKLRKPAGLWAFGFGALHFGLSFVESTPRGTYLTPPLPLYIVLGVVGLLILAALASTSTRWAQRRLGKNWKRLHRLVYAGGIAAVAHALLATEMSKRVYVRYPDLTYEVRVYIVILTILLILRLPFVRQVLREGAFQLARRLGEA